MSKSDDEQEAKRQSHGREARFDAYGVGLDMPDPVARAIGQLLDHLPCVVAGSKACAPRWKELGSDYCARICRALRDEDFADVCKEQGDKPAA